MPLPDSTLTAIRKKVRRLTRAPSTNQLSDEDLDEYINTFILYDFPENIRLFNLRTVFTWYTQPFVDTYSTNTTDVNNAFYNFKNKYIAVHTPVYLAGVQGFYTQWRDIFYGYYPQFNTIAPIPGIVGNGTTGPFNGVITAHPVLANNVVITCLDTNGTAMILVDYPVTNIMGGLGLVNAPTDLTSPYGTVNYVTGQVTGLTFPRTTQDQAPITAETISYQPGKPLALLYYNDTFTVRPVPDQVYVIQVEADIRPTALLDETQTPELEQWWQYISYGAAIKYLQDKLDNETVNLLMPEFKKQETLCLRTTLTQQANERTVTIFTQGKNYGFGWFGPGGWPY